jgi:outer membrane protein assembly factor BamB
MKTVAALALAGGLVTSAALAQPATRVLTRPVVPAREALDRLNMQLAWRASIPMLGVRDGLLSVQTFGSQVVAQTRSGAVVGIDGTTGAIQWIARVSDAYPIAKPAGESETLFLVPEATRIHGLNRMTGREEWTVDLPATPASPPNADFERFYVSLSNGRLSAYAFPAGSTLAKGQKAAPRPTAGSEKAARSYNPATTANQTDPRSKSGASSPSGALGRTVTVSTSVAARTATSSGVMFTGRSAVGSVAVTQVSRDAPVGDTPRLLWDHQTNLRIQNPPALGSDTLLIVGTDGTVVLMPKTGPGVRPWRRVLDAAVTAPLAQVGDDVYVAAESGSVYSFHLPNLADYARLTSAGRDEREPPITWRFGANAPVRIAPMVAGDDIFLTPDHGGLIRLNRATGDQIWQSPNAHRYLAANPKFVYAADRMGRLVVLDRVRGTVLSMLDVSAFVVETTNDQTDRVILSANDGTVIALHDRAFQAPLALHFPKPLPSKPEGLVPETKPGEDKPAADEKKAAEDTKPADAKAPPAGDKKDQ